MRHDPDLRSSVKSHLVQMCLPESDAAARGRHFIIDKPEKRSSLDVQSPISKLHRGIFKLLELITCAYE